MQRPCLKDREALVEKTDENGRSLLNNNQAAGGARSGADSGATVITNSRVTKPPKNRNLDTPDSGVLHTLPRIVVA
jgi:hypothetical protein